MADQHNVYDTPRSPLEGGGRAGQVSSGVIEHLRGTGGWVRFMSILFFLGTALMAIFGAVIAAIGIFGGGGEAFAEMGGAMGGVVMGGVYLVSAVLYLFPGIYLFKYASAIKRCVTSATSDDVELAIAQQRYFWRFVGVLTLVFMVLAVGGVAVAMVVGFAAAGLGAFQ